MVTMPPFSTPPSRCVRHAWRAIICLTALLLLAGCQIPLEHRPATRIHPDWDQFMRTDSDWSRIGVHAFDNKDRDRSEMGELRSVIKTFMRNNGISNIDKKEYK